MNSNRSVTGLCRSVSVSHIFSPHNSVEVVRAVRADELFRCIKRERYFLLQDQVSIKVSDPNFFSRSVHGF